MASVIKFNLKTKLEGKNNNKIIKYVFFIIITAKFVIFLITASYVKFSKEYCRLKQFAYSLKAEAFNYQYDNYGEMQTCKINYY